MDLAAVDERLAGLLCEQEQARAERILDDRARPLWMRSRGVLRALLGRYLQRDPGTLRFSLGAHGKPALLGGGPAFNLSHSGTLAVYAISASGEVGVDVQLARRRIDEAAIARRFLAAADAQRLAQLPAPERRAEFLRAWVRHEATLKCRGTGFGGDGGAGAEGAAGAGGAGAEGVGGAGAAGVGSAGAAGAAGAGAEGAAVETGAADPADAERMKRALWLADVDVGRGAAAAVASEEDPRDLRCWAW